MRLLRAAGFLFVLIAASAYHADRSVAQGPAYQVGDRLEVQYGYEWFEATVTEVLPSGSVRAAFRDERQYPPEINEIFAVGVMTRPLPGTPQATATAAATASPAAAPANERDESSRPAARAATPPTSASAPAGAGARNFRVGDEVLAICMGARQEAVITGIENDQYRIRWVGGSCGEFRDDSTVFPRPASTPAAATGPLPRSLEGGTYTCFASVPHYAGSTYMPGVGSMPQYTFTWERVGTLILGAGTYRSESRGSTARFRYDAATGSITWEGGMHAGIRSNFAYSDAGEPEIQIHRRDGQRGTWHCRR